MRHRRAAYRRRRHALRQRRRRPGRRYCALAADDPWAGGGPSRLAEIPQRTLLIDRRTGTTTPDLWPDAPSRIRDTRDIDDWLAIIAAGGGIGITPEEPRPIPTRRRCLPAVARRPAIAVHMIWRRHDPHPSTHAAVAPLTELYRRRHNTKVEVVQDQAGSGGPLRNRRWLPA